MKGQKIDNQGLNSTINFSKEIFEKNLLNIMYIIETNPFNRMTLEEKKEHLLEKIRKQYNSLLNEYPNLKTIYDVEKLIKAIKFYKIALLNSKAKKTATKQKQTKLQERIKTLILKDKLSKIIDFNSTKLLEQTTYYKIKTILP